MRAINKNVFSKIIVILIVLLNTVFTGAVLYVFLRVGSEPVTLIGAWFTFTTGELVILKSIKKSKIETRDNEGIGDINEQD